MTTAHDAIAALPVTGNADKALVRAMATKRMPYALADSESAADFIVVDPDAGTVPLYLIQSGTLYEYDSLDSTSVAGATCLVTNDGKRYKSGPIDYPWSVLTKSTSAQPVSPSLGDRYLVPTAATGTDWSGKDGKVAIYTAAGWQFAIVPVGRGLYVEDTDARWYRNAAGTWTAGYGSIALSNGSVPITAILGAKASFVIKVENQTTNTPPSSPVAPVAYIIGPSPTGAWSGNAGKLAICLVTGAFTIIAPDTGDSVFDKSLRIRVEWSGAAWASAQGALVGTPQSYLTTSGSTSSGGSGAYTYSNTVAPTTAFDYKEDSVTITYAAKKSGARLRFFYQFVSGNANNIVAAIFQDSNSTAVAWTGPMTMTSGIVAFFLLEYVTADSSSHVYKVRLVNSGTGTPGVPTMRRFSVEEFA